MSLARRALVPSAVAPRSRARASFGALGVLVAAASLALLVSPSSAGAGEPPAAATPVVVAPRQAALETVIRRLERHLVLLRRSRTELESGRTEPVPADDAARRRADVDLRALRDVARYEAARTRAVAAVAEAETSKDAAKVGEAKAALDTLDVKFVDGIKKLEDGLDAPSSASGKPAAGDAAAPKGAAAPAPARAPKKAPKKEAREGAGMSSMPEGDSIDAGDDDDGDEDVTDGDDAPPK